MTAGGGERRAVVARELTKLHEEFRRGTVAELAAYYEATAPRGEVVVLIEGAPAAVPDHEGGSAARRSTACRGFLGPRHGPSPARGVRRGTKRGVSIGAGQLMSLRPWIGRRAVVACALAGAGATAPRATHAASAVAASRVMHRSRALRRWRRLVRESVEPEEPDQGGGRTHVAADRSQEHAVTFRDPQLFDYQFLH